MYVWKEKKVKHNGVVGGRNLWKYVPSTISQMPIEGWHPTWMDLAWQRHHRAKSLLKGKDNEVNEPAVDMKDTEFNASGDSIHAYTCIKPR